MRVYGYPGLDITQAVRELRRRISRPEVFNDMQSEEQLGLLELPGSRESLRRFMEAIEGKTVIYSSHPTQGICEGFKARDVHVKLGAGERTRGFLRRHPIYMELTHAGGFRFDRRCARSFVGFGVSENVYALERRVRIPLDWSGHITPPLIQPKDNGKTHYLRKAG